MSVNTQITNYIITKARNYSKYIVISLIIITFMLLVIALCFFYCCLAGPYSSKSQFRKGLNRWLIRRAWVKSKSRKKEKMRGGSVEMNSDSESQSTSRMNPKEQIDLGKPIKIVDDSDSSTVTKDEAKMVIGKQVHPNINIRSSIPDLEQRRDAS